MYEIIQFVSTCCHLVKTLRDVCPTEMVSVSVWAQLIAEFVAKEVRLFLKRNLICSRYVLRKYCKTVLT